MLDDLEAEKVPPLLGKSNYISVNSDERSDEKALFPPTNPSLNGLMKFCFPTYLVVKNFFFANWETTKEHGVGGTKRGFLFLARSVS